MTTLIRSSGLIDGTGTGFRAGVGLLVERGYISEVGPVEALRERADEIIDLGEAVLLPGFIDAHTHLTIRPGEGDQHGQLALPYVRQVLRGVSNVKKMLHSGVTTAPHHG